MNFKSHNGTGGDRRLWRAKKTSRGIRVYHIFPDGDEVPYFLTPITRSNLKAVVARRWAYIGSWTATYPDKAHFQVGCQIFTMATARKLLKLLDSTRTVPKSRKRKK